MRITEYENGKIVFDNGNEITYDHVQDCCEDNYADFIQLDDLAKETEFDEDLKFEALDELGFRFGNEGKMFFIPCYSVQNGYYSSDVDIFYNGKHVLNLTADIKDEDRF